MIYTPPIDPPSICRDLPQKLSKNLSHLSYKIIMKTLKRQTDYRKNYEGDISTSRSDKYQYLIAEVAYTSEFLDSFTSPQSENISQIDMEKLWDLEQELQNIMWQLIEKNLSPNQIEVLKLQQKAIYQGEGQMWMAEQMGVNQSSIHKCLNGNVTYCGGVVKRYGGIAKKLSKLIKECELVKTTMLEIESLDYQDMRLPHFKCFKKIIGTELEYQKYLKMEDHGSHLQNLSQ
jgi:hypothetical protein